MVCHEEKLSTAEIYPEPPSLVAEVEVSGKSKTIQHQNPPAPTSNSMLKLCCCFLGILVSFSLNGLVLEKMTSHHVLSEMALTFFFSGVYASVAFLGQFAVSVYSKADHQQTTDSTTTKKIPQWKLFLVAVMAFGSTITSIIALRYVSFITRILGKSCKSIPVMLIGCLFLGKTYKLQKYISVLILSVGVAIFLLGTTHTHHKHAAQPDHHQKNIHHNRDNSEMIWGSILLLISLIFDGATGALEDKYISEYKLSTFNLMFNLNKYKSLFGFAGMVLSGNLPTFLEKVWIVLPNLIVLSLTGALGQSFIFYTIAHFGALTTSIIGTCRKVVSIVLSVILFGHVLSSSQVIGIVITFAGILLNSIRGVNWSLFFVIPCTKTVDVQSGHKNSGEGGEEIMVLLEEGVVLKNEDIVNSNQNLHHTCTSSSDEVQKEQQRKLDIVGKWNIEENAEVSSTDK